MKARKLIGLMMPACALFVVFGQAWAEDKAPTPEITAKLDIAYVTKYVWRGVPLNADPAVQPSVTFTHKSGLSLNLWGSYDTTNVNGHKNKVTEIDSTLNYATKLQGKDVNVGIVNYAFPNTVAPTTSEVYGSWSFGGKLSPTVQAFYDIDKAHGIYVQASAGYNYPLPSLKQAPTLALSGKIGWGDSRHNRYNEAGADTDGFTDALIGAALPITATPRITVTPSVNFSTILNSKIRDAFKTAGLKRNNFFAGVDIAFAL
jgi:uncharacterized protein (TIGR02001 family)